MELEAKFKARIREKKYVATIFNLKKTNDTQIL